jgi:hypothetical protein
MDGWHLSALDINPFRVLRIMAWLVTVFQWCLGIVLGANASRLGGWADVVWLVQAISPGMCSVILGVTLTVKRKVAVKRAEAPESAEALQSAEEMSTNIGHFWVWIVLDAGICIISCILFGIGREWGSQKMCLVQHACAVTTHLTRSLRRCLKITAASEIQENLTSLSLRPMVGPTSITMVLYC